MAEMSRTRRAAVSLLFAAAVIIFLAACDDIQSSSESVQDFSDDYTASQSTGDRAANASGRTGDDEVDGILWVAKTMDDITLAENAYRAANAIARSDPDAAADKYDRAIQLRPDDMTYRRQRVIHAALQDDAAVALEQWEQQDRIAAEQGVADEFWYWSNQYKDLEAMQNLLGSQYTSPSQGTPPEKRAVGVALYTRGAKVFEELADWYTLDGQIEKANEAMRAAEVHRRLAEEFSSP